VTERKGGTTVETPAADAVERTGLIRVMIADDEPAVCDALSSLIGEDPEISVVGTGGDAEQAIAIARRERPDVALLDVRMPRGGGPRAAREIRRVSPSTELIALSADDGGQEVDVMIRAGAGAYLVKGDGGGDEIVEAIHRCAHGTDGRTHLAALAPPSLGVHPFRNRERLQRIESVIDGTGIEVVYQPIFDLQNGKPLGAEALCRFQVAPLRSPDVWFAEAAEVGLGIELEIAALRLALRGLDRLDGSIVMGINVSPETCCSADLRELLEDVPAERVVLEITEHAPVADYGVLKASLDPLRERGLGLAIDDTCSGFASLRHVLNLRPDVIKLDVTLTREVESDGARRALIEALAGFAPSVGATILAEGIETVEQLRILREAGVRSGQGYLLGRPGPLPRLGTWPALTEGAGPDDARSAPLAAERTNILVLASNASGPRAVTRALEMARAWQADHPNDPMVSEVIGILRNGPRPVEVVDLSEEGHFARPVGS
jgi:EAL domain-containing protein (putative c-di-GMP-specific phosphodiesterase class I)/CheY-like chemotaxis protein